MISTTVRRLSRPNLSQPRGRRLGALAGVSLLSLVLATPAWAGPDGPTGTALPTGGQVVAGEATIGTSGAAMTVTQSTRRGIINWQGFDIGSDASVQFVQPDASSVTLNRVLGGNGSTIAGKLSANGKVYVVNPNGVLFTSTAQVDVGGLVAAAGDIADSDFLAGKDAFTISPTASVINQGSLTARNGGAVVLVGGSVSNLGTIGAERGDVVLASGSKVTLDAGADGHLKVEVDPATSQALVQNGGLIAAGGGQVLLTAQGAGAAVSSIVSNIGTIEARTLSNQSGKILLLADMQGGVTQAGGTLDASAPDGGDGGFVETSAHMVGFGDDLQVLTSAANGTTGTWLIDPYDLTISANSSYSLGINVVGNPGYVGSIGTTSNLNNATLSGWLNSANIIVLVDGGGGGQAGNITVNDAVTWSAATTLTLNANSSTGGIFLNAAITGSNANSGLALNAGVGGINQNASGAITVGTLTANAANGGGVMLHVADNQVTRLGASSASGIFYFGNGTALTVTGAVASSSGLVSLIAAGDLTINAALTDTAVGAGYTLQSSGGTLTIAKDVTLSGQSASLYLSAASGYALTGGARISLPGSAANLRINGNAYTLIHNATQLQAIPASATGYYALGNDIDASATATWNSGAGFATLDNFQGIFAGLGHAIDGLTVNRPNQGQTGLFGSTNNAVLRDFTLSNATVTGSSRVGAVVGYAGGTTLSNVHVTGSVSAFQEAGGVVGWLFDSTLNGVSSAASVAISQNKAGGLAGYVFSTASITNSYAVGAVTGTSMVGGLIGDTDNGITLTLTNVYASGRVSGSSLTGGLIGQWRGSTANISGALWDVGSTGVSTSALGLGFVHGIAYNQNTYSGFGFDFTNTWVMLPGDTRPMLRNEASSVIFTPHALQLMSLNLAGSYTLGADIDLTPAFTLNGGYYGDVWNTTGFAPIGSGGTPFTGSLNGNSHSITGLTISRSGTNYVGLFGYVTGGTIANLRLIGGSVTGNDGVGALVGYLLGGSVSSSGASTAVTGSSTTEANTGGLVGTNNGGAIADSWASGAVTGAGYQIGGLVGFNANGATITRSYATGNVTGTNANAGYGYIGGLVGGNGFSGDGGTISQSYATGTVTGAAGPVGGFVGHNDGTITDSYATGAVTGTGSAGNIGGFVGVNYINGTIHSAFSTGRVVGASRGGFAGYNNGAAGSIINAYWDTQTTGLALGVSGGQAAGITGRTTAQLQAALPTGFSSSIWGTGTNLYPYLGWRYTSTPVAVSGSAYTDLTGAIALSGAAVTALTNGTVFGSATTGANGYFYILGDAGTLGSNGVITYLDNGATRGATYADALSSNGIQNISLLGSTLQLSTNRASLTATQAGFLATLGSYSDSDLAFVTGAGLSTATGYGMQIRTGSNYLLDANLNSGGALSVGNGTMAVTGDISLTANGALDISGLTWTDASSLALITTAGNDIALVGVSAPAGTLSLSSGRDITINSTLSVNTFKLLSGTWSQIGTLPNFSVVDFQLTPSATFIRARGGDGTVANPYQIADVYGLQGMASISLRAQNFVLANDINASSAAAWNGLAGFLPIGSSLSNAFTGSLNGNGHAITGLRINRPGTSNVGLFGYSAGTISNLSLTGNVTGGSMTGSLIGAMTGGSVTGVRAAVTVTGTGSQVGGLVGSLQGGTITLSSASGNVSGVASAGGLVGAQSGTSGIDQSFATGTVQASNFSAGGLLGQMTGGTISNSYATGAATATNNQAGGLVGLAIGSSTISNSYASGTATSSAVAGGLIGYLDGTVTNSFWNTTTSGKSNAIGGGSGSTAGITGLSTAQMTSLASFASAGWNIDDAGGTGAVWRIYDGYSTPLLRGFLTPLTATGGNVTQTYSGSATSTPGTLTYSVGTPDYSRLFGTPLYVASSANAGTYSGSSLRLTGLYSNQAGYDIIAVPGSFQILPADLIVTVNGATRVYNGLGYSGGNGVSYTGFVNNEDASVLGGTLTYGGAAQGAINVGTYALSASGLTSGNYTIHYTPGLLSITRATLIIKASDATRTYTGLGYAGGNGVTYTGFVNNEDASVLSGTLAYGGAAQGAVNAGTYGLTASGLTSGNYTISYLAGTLTINRAPLVVTASNATSTYNGLAYSGGNGVSYAGFVNGEGASVLGGTLAYGGSAQGAVNAGTYGLTASGLTSGNYAISYAPGTLTIDPAALTITVNGATKTYDGLAYTGGNGVSYAGFVNGEGTSVLGGTLVYGGSAQGAINAGSYGLTASGLTSGNYAISYVDGSLVVNPAALTVTVGDATKTYDGLAYSGGNGVTYTGLVNGETSAVLGGSLAYGGTAQGAVNAGTYGLTASGLTSGNYAISYVDGTVTVNPALLTVTVNGATKTYDGLAYSGGNGVTYTGLVNGETAAVLGGTLVYGGTAQGAVNAGSYGLTASGLTSGNYAISYVDGSLTVNPALLTVTVNNATSTYTGLGYSGGNGVSYLGFVNGEGASVLGGTLVYGGTAQGAVNAGSYGLTASGLTSGNYTINYVDGTVTVNPALLTVTVNGATKTYDGLAYSGGNGVTYTGLVNGEGASVLGGTLVYGGTAQGAINAGAYGLTASGLASGNYAISYVDGSLTVNPAALTITVGNATKTYDGLAYSGGNGVTYTGLVNGETAAVLGGSLAYGGTAQGAVNAGSYGLTASGLTSGNYTINYVDGTVTVNPALLTVTVNGATKTYDGLAYSGGNGVTYTGLVNGETAAVLGGSLAYGGTAQGAV
ncbi:MBG domain-containing protein, partial [Sphingomonas sp. HITSZ_GF]|uniref:beta strand repeat-containing protein n=1 Tax=Sphingomonas sp. HITSZ_GF TaxID=3037247 RepID=UPI00240D5E89